MIGIKTIGQLLKIGFTGTSKEQSIAIRLTALLVKNTGKIFSYKDASKKLNSSINAKITLEALKQAAKNLPETI